MVHIIAVYATFFMQIVFITHLIFFGNFESVTDISDSLALQ
jgi:hypothetical protein